MRSLNNDKATLAAVGWHCLLWFCCQQRRAYSLAQDKIFGGVFLEFRLSATSKYRRKTGPRGKQRQNFCGLMTMPKHLPQLIDGLLGIQIDPKTLHEEIRQPCSFFECFQSVAVRL